MKYLVYIEASQQLKDKISEYRTLLGSNVVKVPALGNHCTMMSFVSRIDCEHDIVAALMRLSSKFRPIYMKCASVASFDDNMMVVKVQKTDQIEQVHEQVVFAMQQFMDWRRVPELPLKYKDDPLRCAVYKKSGSPYFLACYNPHITIANAKTDFVQLGDFFEGIFWTAYDLHLARRELDGWHDVATIHIN